MSRKLLLAAVILLLAAGCTAQQKTQPQKPTVSTPVASVPVVPPPAPAQGPVLQNQEWGNASIILNIGTTSSSVELACSSGLITEQFQTSKVTGIQKFYLAGKYYPGGPPRAIIGIDGKPQAPDYSTTFSGTISGGVMHFMISPKEVGGQQSEVLTQGHFTLQGKPCPL